MGLDIAVGPGPSPSPIRCRRIGEGDLPSLVRLLAKGFPDRGEAWWRSSLGRLWSHAGGMEVPDCGRLLEVNGAVVGALLVIHARDGAGQAGPRCNLSSWYVEPERASYAPLLVAQATKRRDVTYFNISPAPHTLPIIEAQGFARYADDRTLILPWMSARVSGGRVRAFDPARDHGLAVGEAEMLARHEAHGCLALSVEAGDGAHPFLFRPGRLRGGLRVATLLYCRDVDALVRFSGPLGRALLRRGLPAIAVEGDARRPGLPCWYRVGRAPRYAKGPRLPRTGDLTDTELALFGP